VEGGRYQLNKIKLNGVEIICDNLEKITDPEDKLLEIKFSFRTKGNNEFYLFKNLLSSKEEISIFLEEHQEIKGKIKDYSYYYQDDITEHTVVPFSVTFKEMDPKNRDWDIQTGLSIYTVKTLVSLKALKELLIEKGVIGSDELNKKVAEIMDRDYQKIINGLLTGNEDDDRYNKEILESED